MLSRRTLLRTGATAALAMTAVPALTPPATAAPGGAGAGTAGEPDPAALQAALDRIVTAGGTAALARVEGFGCRWTGSSGAAVLGRPHPPAPTGHFRIGSITKTFVSTVVLQLVGQRRLGLDDPVQRWLPGALPDGGRITVRHLLQHTSGLFNYTDILFADADEFLRNRFRTFSAEQLLALAVAQPPLFEPGTSWSYSNTNYVVLGLIIERITGRRYGAEVARRVLRPLDLDNTHVPGARARLPHPHARGYLGVERDGQPTLVDVTELNPSIAWAAGEMVSTTRDLNRFLRALLGGRLVRPAQLAEMLTPVGEAEYGLGVYRFQVPGGPTLWGHDGGIPGFVTVALSTLDASGQIALSINPGLGDFFPAVIDFILLAVGAPAPVARAARPALPMLDRPLV